MYRVIGTCAVVAVVIGTLGVAVSKYFAAAKYFDSPVTVVSRAAIGFPDETTVTAEIADSPQERATGLSEHVYLHEDHGMLFLLDAPSQPSFWMKDMKFPIDIVWISGETVVDMDENVQGPGSGVKDSELPKVLPEVLVDKVLEVNAGFVAAHGISKGDHLDIRLP
jgi:hypothetical protein